MTDPVQQTTDCATCGGRGFIDGSGETCPTCRGQGEQATTEDVAEYHAHEAGFVFEAQAGLTVETARGSVWLSWDETVALAAWLAEQMETANGKQ